ncbi:hypothetical protein ACIXJN_21285 [Bacteroides fragilis]
MMKTTGEIVNDRIDWEQRRYEIAKAAMQGILCAPIIYGEDPNSTPCRRTY